MSDTRLGASDVERDDVINHHMKDTADEPSFHNTERRKLKKAHRDSEENSSFSSNSISSESSYQRRKRTKRKKKEQRRRKKHSSNKRHRRRQYSSSDSGSTSDCSGRERKRRKKKHKKKSRKAKNVIENDEQVCHGHDVNIDKNTPANPPAKPYIEATTHTERAGEDIQKQAASRRMVPMTREQYEAEQSKVREVYDPESGRTRLVRGGGEIIERIVSRQAHQQINQQATIGDGSSFSRMIHKASSVGKR